MIVVVTGGAGFIGANLCRHLAQDATVDAVIALDDLSTGRRENLDGLEVELVEGSFLDDDTLRSVAGRADAIVHLGARPSVPRSIADPVATHEVNARGTVCVLEAARQTGAHVVVASSSSVYGANPELPKHEEMATRPMSPYAASKLAAESYALSWQHSFELPALVLRFFNVFGPLQGADHAYAAVVPAFVSAALADRPLKVHGDGSQSRDFTYVDTVCEVIVDALRRRVTSEEPVNLAYGTRTDLLEMISILGELLGKELAVEHTATRIGDVPHSQAANDRLRALFPDVAPLPLRPGLERTVEWFRSLTVGVTR